MLLVPIMSAIAKNLPEGLKDLECEREDIVNQPPIPYVEPADPNGKQETTKIKVELPDEIQLPDGSLPIRDQQELRHSHHC
jgi:hypothetical protein